jgi:hypothetical protein
MSVAFSAAVSFLRIAAIAQDNSLLIKRVERLPEILAKGLNCVPDLQGEMNVCDLQCLEQTLERREKR